VNRLSALLRRLRRDERGVAAVEMALVTGFFCVAIFNAVEVGRYAYILMEAGQATQAGAQAAYVACDSNHLPATENCPALTPAVTTAIQSTTLGAAIALNGPVTEGYYCLDASNALVYVAPVDAKPGDCSDVGQPALTPALYLQVATTYSFTPIFDGLTVGSTFPASVRKTAWMRMR
jgi:Flp pilus assembly protein TadG